MFGLALPAYKIHRPSLILAPAMCVGCCSPWLWSGNSGFVLGTPMWCVGGFLGRPGDFRNACGELSCFRCLQVRIRIGWSVVQYSHSETCVGAHPLHAPHAPPFTSCRNNNALQAAVAGLKRSRWGVRIACFKAGGLAVKEEAPLLTLAIKLHCLSMPES